MNKLQVAALCLSVVLAAPGVAAAQDATSPIPASASDFSPEELDEMVAPVALYPDPLLADVLTASTYPLEVVDADRWASDPQNSALSGDDLTNALASRGWDPSVQSLAPFPQVLQLMDSHLDWMEALGEAFLAQPGDVMNAVQRMRARAQSAGNLPSNGEETVSDEDDTVAISPPSDLVYVPEYDPWCAFGDWPYPVDTQSYFGSWSGNCDPADYGVVFGPGIVWPFSYWAWDYFDWRSRRVLIHPDMYRQFHPTRSPKGVVWQHDPQHRDGVFYRNPQNIRSFGQPARGPSSQMSTSGLVEPPRPDQNWRSNPTYRTQPRPTIPSSSFHRPSFGRPAPHIANGHASREPARH